ncbi:MAG: hypothetical protein ACR2HO_10860 [Rubrobacteraceae bacterium]|nr:hypothetical protein [Rubrobacter sp.]
MPGLAALLAERLGASDFQSLLLEVYRLRARRRRTPEILSDYEADRFVRPSRASSRKLLEWEHIALSRLPSDFEPVELSPVCPLGTSASIASVSQDWAVATERNTEVVSDSTNALAMECATRRRGLLRSDPRSRQPVHLAASHRLLRAQRYRNPDLAPQHFQLFALCSAGRDTGNFGFEIVTLTLHIHFYLSVLRAYLGASPALRLVLSDSGNIPAFPDLAERLFAPVRTTFGDVECVIDRERAGGHGYYTSLCFKIHAIEPSEREFELVDGGVVDWTQRQLSNAKERLIVSGIGSERVCALSGADL